MKINGLNTIMNDMNMMNKEDAVSKNIKKQRKLKGLTQKKLAEITYYSYEFVRKIESKSACRNTFSLSTVDKISQALGINIQVLFEPLDEEKIS